MNRVKAISEKQKIEGVMPDHLIVKGAVKSMIEIVKHNRSEMKVVDDHHICYGVDIPLCGNDLGEKGITKDVIMITCPECKIALNNA